MKLTKLFVFAALVPMLLTTGCNKKKEKKITSVTLTAESAKTESGFDAVIDAGGTQLLKYTYSPEDLKPTFSWTSTAEGVATITPKEGGGTLNAKGAGEAEVYVTADGVESNHLKIKVVESGKTNEDFPKAKTTYVKNGVEKPLNMQTIYTNQNAPHLDPLSEAHVLVVPFGFTDDDLQTVQTAENIERIRKTFFGTREEMQAAGAWYSMAEFYQTSSYGKSDFQGDVLPVWCTYTGTSTAFESDSHGSGGPFAAEYARTWYKTEYDKANHGALGADAKPITYYDANNDGFLDLVWVVYSHKTVDTNFWWAYVTYTGNGSNKSFPSVKTLGWASVDWMDQGFGGLDPHTFIHETGHTYGLDDYYDYNKRWAPMGGVDFMDHNLGDHCMFSKFSLGWTSPWVVDDDSIITLRPGTTTGDCFIIPSPGYNGTAFDEYIMVELMAPVGLAEQDYKNGYEGTSGFSEPGLRITHVDARVYKGNHDTYLTDNPQEGIDFRVCNTQGGRSGIKIDGDYWQVDAGGGDIEKSYYALTTVIESVINTSDNVLTRSTYNVSNSSLFKEGQRFDLKPAKSGGSSWSSVFMPSRTNLWNKAKTTTGWSGAEQKPQSVDTDCTFNYSLKVLSIQADAQYGYVAKVKVDANAY